MAVEARRSKTRCLALILAAIIVQILIIVLFFVLIFRVRTPRVRLGSVSVQHLRVNSNSLDRPFNLKLSAQVTVKNTNFGRYKFEETKAIVSYRGNEVGTANIAKGRAKARHTQKFNVTISLNSNKVSSDSHLRSDLNSKSLTLTAHAKFTGKIHVLKIFRRRRSAQMNCTFVVNTSSKTVKDLSCH